MPATDPQRFEPDTFQRLDDQLWRRLGVTQTFDRLLVEAAGVAPGAVADVQAQVGEKLAGGAVKFWDLSFPRLRKELCRRRILVENELGLSLSSEFAERLERLVSDLDRGTSRVEPTPGVELSDVLDRVAARESQEKAKKAARPRASRAATVGPQKRTRADAGRPQGDAPPPRSTAAGAGNAGDARTVVRAPAPKPAPSTTPPSELFTGRRLNRLFEGLDNSRMLLRTQLGGRLDIGSRDLERFLEITDAAMITREVGDGMVELNFRGRELARTSTGERRTTLIALVKELRAAAEVVADTDT